MGNNELAGVIRALGKSVGGEFTPEVWHVDTFEIFRQSPTHGHQQVEVKILESWIGNEAAYMVSATTEDGQSCSGNSEKDIETAIAVTHWYRLDQ